MVPSPTQAAHAAARSRTLRVLARGGLVSWGVLHLALAWICLRLAAGERRGDADQAGALATLAASPGGAGLLAVVAVGFLACGVWQVTEAIRGHSDRSPGAERAVHRAVSAGRAVLFGTLAVTSVTFTAGNRDPHAAESQQSTTAALLALPGGQLLVGAIGLAVVVAGVVLVCRGVTRRFRENLDTAAMPREVERPTELLGVVGYTAKGAVLGVAGALVVAAAVTFDPEKSRGLDAALRTLGEQPYGRVLLLAAAVGLACFGVYTVVDARYRSIT